MKAPKRILVPTDFSQYADKALDEALVYAKQFDAQVYLLHVVEDIQQCVDEYCLTVEWLEEYKTNSFKTSKEKLKAAVEKRKEAKDLQIKTDVRMGKPAEEILKEAEERKVDLIVIASHGKTGFLQRLMGSVAERVSREAKCQVMLVKA